VREEHESRVERFRALYDAVYPRVMAYALRRARTREDALDAVAETMFIAWRRLDDIPADGRRVPWVFGVARRVLANHYRSADRRDRLMTRLDPARDAADPEFEAVHEALDALSPAQREILTLSAWDDLDNEEIAVILGISPGAVALRLHRARRRLARELGRLGIRAERDSPTSGGPDRTPYGVRSSPPGSEEKDRT
jgi:RNA polymerase sigma factor (sigma-70 family)